MIMGHCGQSEHEKEEKSWSRGDDPGACEEESHQTSSPTKILLPFHLLLPLLVLVHLLLAESLLILFLSEASAKHAQRKMSTRKRTRVPDTTNLLISSLSRSIASASISSSSLSTVLFTYDDRSFPNSFQISDL